MIRCETLLAEHEVGFEGFAGCLALFRHIVLGTLLADHKSKAAGAAGCSVLHALLFFSMATPPCFAQRPAVHTTT